MTTFSPRPTRPLYETRSSAIRRDSIKLKSMFLNAPQTVPLDPAPLQIIESRPAEVSCGLHTHALIYEDARDITDALAKLTGIERQKPRGTCKGTYGFPGPNPVSIDSGDFSKLKRQAYFLTEKTDGMRVVLYFTRHRDINMVVMFDRTMSVPYILGPIERVPKSLYQGTVIDAEIININGTWTILIFDSLFVAGVATFHLPFLERLAAIKSPLQKWYTPDPSDLVVLVLKNFHAFTSLDDVAAFQAYLPMVPCKTDGTILMPADEPVVYGRHDTLFKLKTHHTVDFLTKNKKLLIFDEKLRRNVIVGIPAGPNKSLADVDGRVLECEFDGKAWCPLTIRTDKNVANNRLTLDKTLLNIRENLTLGTIATTIFGN